MEPVQHQHDPAPWPVDRAMRPLVRAVVDASKGMGMHLDDAVKLYTRQGYLDPVKLVRGLPWVDAWETPLREAWEQSAATVMLRVRRSMRSADKQVAKDIFEDADLSVQEDLALLFLDKEGANLVVQLSRQNRRAMVEVLDRAIREGWDIPKIVRNIKSMVGLLPKQARAVLTKQAELEARDWTEKRVAAAVEKYANRLLKQRAENIARTETVRALNQGQMQAWNRQVGDSQLPTTVKRKWIAAISERTCPICMELNGMPPVGLKEPFNSPLAGTIMAPPAHPSCRCSMGLV